MNKTNAYVIAALFGMISATTVHIDAADEQRIIGKVGTLANDFEKFDNTHKISQQIETWSTSPTVTQHEAAVQADLNQLGAQLERNNDISGWAARNNIQ